MRELTYPSVNAKVVGVRLLAGSEQTPVNLRIDVDVPSKYWGEEPGETRAY